MLNATNTAKTANVLLANIVSSFKKLGKMVERMGKKDFTSYRLGLSPPLAWVDKTPNTKTIIRE
jgi:hypothetical protein